MLDEIALKTLHKDIEGDQQRNKKRDTEVKQVRMK